MSDYYNAEEPYSNAAGGTTYYRMDRVLDSFEVIDDVSIPDDEPLVEVFSRHLIVKKEMTTDEVVEMYRLGA